jgi:hypothetical protein
VRIDWKNSEIPEAFVLEYNSTMPVYSICAGAASMILGVLALLSIFLER